MALSLIVRENRGDGRPPVEAADVAEDLMAEAVGAEYVEVYIRRVGPEGRPYAIVCDETGRMKGRAPTAYCLDTCGRCYVYFCGDIIVTKTDGRGSLADLKREDFGYLRGSVRILRYAGRPAAMLEIVRR